jgi:hypothetical protein
VWDDAGWRWSKPVRGLCSGLRVSMRPALSPPLRPGSRSYVHLLMSLRNRPLYELLNRFNDPQTTCTTACRSFCLLIFFV